MNHSWGSSNPTVMFHTYEAFTWDPATQVAIHSLNYSEDEITEPFSGLLGRGIIVVQDIVVNNVVVEKGAVFQYQPDAGFNNLDWQNFTKTGIKAENFIYFETRLNPPRLNPDFSASGSPLKFGYVRSQTIPNFQSINHGIDNWRVTILLPDFGFHTVNLSAGGVVQDIDFGNQKVTSPSPNQAPVFTSKPPTTAQVGQLLIYQATATDDLNNDSLTYDLLVKPEGMAVDTTTGILIWQPKQNQVGTYEVQLQVSDGRGGRTIQTFLLNAKLLNRPPQIISSPHTYALLNGTYTYEVRATDFDNDILTYHLINPPLGMTIDRTTGLIEYTPTQLGTKIIEIEVSDGWGGSSTQSYQLQVLETLSNRLPHITSTPSIIIGAGGLYQYDVNATDPENTTITYGLTTKPNGMNIDEETGLITWQTEFSLNNSFQVTVSATDGDSGTAYQNYYVTVAPNQTPIISSTPIELAQTGFVYEYDVIAGDAEGDRLTYVLTQAPTELTIDPLGRIRWQPQSTDKGVYPISIQVNDGRGGIATQNYTLTVTDKDIIDPVVDIGFNTNVIEIGETINFQLIATDNVEVTTLTLTANGTPLTLTPNIPNGQINNATFTAQNPGRYEIIGTATDEAGNIKTVRIEVRVINPNDTQAPSIEIDLSNLQETQGIISEPTDVIATIDDGNFDYYQVEIAPLSAINYNNLAESDPDYILLARGDSNVTGQVIATIDPRLLANEAYIIKISAFDLSGNRNIQGIIVNVTGQNKPGDFALEYTDLFIPLTGIPIEITRRYNSLESYSQGDFSYGWDLSLQDARIVESSPDGRNLSDNSYDIFGNSNTFSVGTKVTLNTPDGRRVGFTFNPVPSNVPFFGTIYSPSFTPDPGVFDKLEVESQPLTLRGDGTVGIFFYSFIGFNPSVYKLTTKNGTVYRYDQNKGLIDITDRNGNVLNYTDQGINSSTGQSIAFQRDFEGRITQITDPEGNSLNYTYDGKGDLVAVRDRNGNVTQFIYDDPNRQHFLTEVVDPLGRQATRTEYDQNGQISKIIDANGNILEIKVDSASSTQSLKDPLGNTITLLFDDQGNVVQEIEPLGGITLKTYDSNNNLLSVNDPKNNTTTYTYDDRGNELTETDGEGNTKHYEYNSSDDLLAEMDALGNVTTYNYDSNGNLTSREDPEGNIITYTYNQYGLLTEFIDAKGGVSHFIFDSVGNLLQLIDPTTAKTTYTYDRNGRLTSTTDPNGAVTNYVYDAQGRLIEQTDPEGNACGCGDRGITRMEYNAADEKIAEIDALGRRIEYIYNERGLLIEIIDPDDTPNDLTNNPRTRYEYDALDRLTVFTDELGRRTQFVYDPLGREIEVIYPDETPDLSDNPHTKTEYDKAGQVTAIIDELGNRTEYDYDQSDRLILVRDALNQVTTYTYDSDGRIIAITDPLGRITNYNYDGLDRLISTTYPNNTVMTNTYDALGRVIAEKDLAENTTDYEYDSVGRLTAVVDALNQRTEYKYDAVGNLIEQKDANGNITKFEYDSLRRLQATILPEGQHDKAIYDQIGNLIEVTDLNGVVTTYKYNERNWLIEKSFSDGTPKEMFTYTPTGELATVTDNRGVTTYTYDERDRLLSRTEPDGRTIEYTYDDAGNILSLTVPSGITTYTYDVLNRIDTVKDADNGVTHYTYDAVGNLIKTEFSNNVTETRQHDLLDRLTYLENRNQAGIISSYTYTLDAMGNRTKAEENNGLMFEYSYDDLYRLTQEKNTDVVAGDKTIDYQYDPVGNRLQRNDSIEGTTIYTYDDNDRLLQETIGGNLTQYQYDAEGNLTTTLKNGTTQATYEWNAKGELTSVEVRENGQTERVEFAYNYNNMRISMKVNGQETRFLIDDNQQRYTQVIEEYQANGTVNNTYTHGWDLISQDNGTNRTFYQVDGLGSTRLLTNANGEVTNTYVYDAYGQLIQQTVNTENNYLFIGEQFEENLGLIYLRARYYQPSTGRFVSTDPFEGYSDLPISLHDYLYAQDNPALFIDLSGLQATVEKGTLSNVEAILQKTIHTCVKSFRAQITDATTEDLVKFFIYSWAGTNPANQVLWYGGSVNADGKGSVTGGRSPKWDRLPEHSADKLKRLDIKVESDTLRARAIAIPLTPQVQSALTKGTNIKAKDFTQKHLRETFEQKFKDLQEELVGKDNLVPAQRARGLKRNPLKKFVDPCPLVSVKEILENSV